MSPLYYIHHTHRKGMTGARSYRETRGGGVYEPSSERPSYR